MKLAELRKAIEKKSITAIPKGFKTSFEWAEEWDCEVSYAQKLLRKSVAQGLAEMGTYRVMRSQRPYRVAHYRFLK